MNNNRGFTLIETLIATMIMMGTIVIVANTWSGNVSRVQKMRIQQRASLLLERLVAETRIKYRKDPSQIPEEDAGEFEDIENYSWELRTQPAEMGTVVEVTLKQLAASLQEEGQVDTNQQLNDILTGTLRDFLNQPDLIREVEFTVLYKKGKREARYKATSYLVNFNAQLPSIPGIGSISPAGDSGNDDSGSGEDSQ